MGTQRVPKMKWVLPWLVRWAFRAGTRDFFLSWLIHSIFLIVPVFQFVVPIAQQAGQAAVLGRLSLSMYLWISGYDSGQRSII